MSLIKWTWKGFYMKHPIGSYMMSEYINNTHDSPLFAEVRDQVEMETIRSFIMNKNQLKKAIKQNIDFKDVLNILVSKKILSND